MIVKNFRNKKVQTVIILLMIILSTMLVNGALSIIMTVKAPINDLVRECKIPEMTVYTENLPQDYLDQMAEDFKKNDDVIGVYQVKRYNLVEDIILH